MKVYTCECATCLLETPIKGAGIPKTWQSKAHLARHLNAKIITGLPRKPRGSLEKMPTNCELCGSNFRDTWVLLRHFKGDPEKHEEQLKAKGIVGYRYPEDYDLEYRRWPVYSKQKQ